MQIFATKIEIYVFLKIIEFNIAYLSVFITFVIKQKIINKFNKKNFELIILIMLYAIVTVDLNFQHDY